VDANKLKLASTIIHIIHIAGIVQATTDILGAGVAGELGALIVRPNFV